VVGQTEQALAGVLHEDAEIVEGRSFSPRPYNHYEPSNTIWWLVPDSEWPAYRFGKAVLSPYLDGGTAILAGLHVEKGYHEVTAAFRPDLRKRGMVLSETWTWEDGFLSSLVDGSLAEAAQAVAASLHVPVLLNVVVSNLPDDAGDADWNMRFQRPDDEDCRPHELGSVWYQMEGGQLQKLGEHCIKAQTAFFTRCASLPDLSAALNRSDVRWMWVDIYIGVRLSLTRGAASDDHTISAASLWSKAFHPWLPWIR